ncbi:MAG: 2'-5' RNA ligase family protein [Actinomycetota bacterium]|nr:2'-5' RNA ligase family protein [Actinomycetota bacterium]
MSTWRDEGKAHSAVLVPVPEADAAVGCWRRGLDPMATAGVPAHITLIVPWLAPEQIGDGELARLQAVVTKTASFAFALRSVERFGRRVLWLAPDPAQPFLDLTLALAEEFNTPPWGGEFDEVVPHLTIAHSIGDAELAATATALGRDLPVVCWAAEVLVMVGDGTRWWELATVSLG